jgi:chemotaxis regulatin CheY-phosphate phosphatase CheZ
MTKLILQAEKELKSIIKDTEKCANSIIKAVEASEGLLEKISDKKLREKLQNHFAKIIENCHFQDFCGQRSNKIIGYLSEIKNSGVNADLKKKTGEAGLLNGPSTKKTSQAAIDKLFGGF